MLFPVVCEVGAISGGYRSPAAGYNVTAGTTVTTFCNEDYSLEEGEEDTALCSGAPLPDCYSEYRELYWSREQLVIPTNLFWSLVQFHIYTGLYALADS